MKRRLLILGLFCTVAFTGAAGAQDKPDWYQVQGKVVEMLVDHRRDIVDVAGEVTAEQPRTPEQAMIKFGVLLRAGMNDAAAEAVEQLARLQPETDGYTVGGMYNATRDIPGAWPVARRIAEVFAGTVTDLSLEYQLIKQWQQAGGTFEDIDAWLAEMPAGRDGWWIKERLRFNERNGRGEQLRRKLEAAVRKDPADIDGVLVYLDALAFAGGPHDALALGWMPEAVKTDSAIDAEKIGGRLKSLEKWAEAAAFYERAVDVELTEEQIRDYGSGFQMMMSGRSLQAIFAVGVREHLAECLLKMGQADEAQKRMVEAADIRRDNDLPINARLAGAVQLASGARVIEGRIREQQELSQDDPQYWRRRADYYRGRNETQSEEQALIKGLSLTEPKGRPEQPGKGFVDMRSWLLSDYALFLRRTGREEQAMELLRKEIADSPADSVSSEQAARLLGYEFHKHLRPDDELLWRWFAQRDKWEYVEERLLWRMLERAEADEIDGYLSQAEKLARDGDPSRAYILGWIENRMQFAGRSIPLLNDAVDRAAEEELREKSAFTLFESYLDIGDFKRAEESFPRAKKRLTTAECGEWNARIALKAAEAGAKDDAMRIWKIWANENPARAMYLDRLAKAGLREQLRAYYRRLAERLPQSQTPEIVLKMLAE